MDNILIFITSFLLIGIIFLRIVKNKIELKHQEDLRRKWKEYKEGNQSLEDIEEEMSIKKINMATQRYGYPLSKYYRLK
jgi:hypothetical protein